MLGDAGLYYSGSEDLARQLQRVLDDGDLAADMRHRAAARARELFSWDAIADAYEGWLLSLTRTSAGAAA